VGFIRHYIHNAVDWTYDAWYDVYNREMRQMPQPKEHPDKCPCCGSNYLMVQACGKCFMPMDYSKTVQKCECGGGYWCWMGDKYEWIQTEVKNNT